MRCPGLLLTAMLASLVSGNACAGAARDRLEAFTRGLDSLSGSFEQQTVGTDGVAAETTRGTLALRAPRQFRWEYSAPFPQLIVADGDNVWIHDIDLEQVTVRQQASEEARSPLTVLIDFSQLDRDYRVAEGRTDDGAPTLLLTPRATDEGASLTECIIAFGVAGAGPVSMSVRDGLGQRTVWKFGDWVRNPPLGDALFEFTPPPGADVIGQAVPPPDTQPIRE